MKKTLGTILLAVLLVAAVAVAEDALLSAARALAPAEAAALADDGNLSQWERD